MASINNIDLNDIISSLIDERLNKSKDSLIEEEKEYYEKLNEIILNEKSNDNQLNHEQKLKEVQEKIENKKRKPKLSKLSSSEEKTVKKTWSKLSDKNKELIIDEYIKENKITDKTLKHRILNKEINARNIIYDKENEKIIKIKE